MTDHTEDIVPEGDPGESTDHIFVHEEMAEAWNRREILIPCITDGTTDNTAMIEAYHDDAMPGSMLVLPRGPIAVNPFTLSKMLHFRGAGRFSTWFVPLTDSTDPLITVDTTIDSGHGIFGNYGTILEGFGIDRSAHPAGPCLHTESTAAHLTYRDILCSGGTRGCEHHAPNAVMDGLHLWDSSERMLHMDESGLEVHMNHVVMAAQVVDVDEYWRITISPGASGGLLGGIYIGDVSCRSDPAVTVGAGVIIEADSSTEIPTFGGPLVVDNVNGGGPVVDLINVQSVSLNGWLNGTDGCVRMDGCTGIEVNARTRGGTHTFEFVGAQTVGFKSRSEVFTGPAYKLTVPPDADGFDVDDWVALATTISQITDDPEAFFDLGKRSWRTLRLQGMLRQREVGDSPPQGFGTMVAGVLVINHPNVQTNTRFDFWRETTGATGTPGVLIHDVANNVVGTSASILSTSATDTGRIGWRFMGDAD